MQNATRILCVGSPFGEDALGEQAYRALRARLPAADLRYLDRPGVGLVAALEGARRVILIDAVASGAPPGTLHRFEGRAIAARLARVTSSHGFGLAEALALADSLGALPEQVVLYGIEMGGGGASLPALVAAVAAEFEGRIPCAS